MKVNKILYFFILFNFIFTCNSSVNLQNNFVSALTFVESNLLSINFFGNANVIAPTLC